MAHGHIDLGPPEAVRLRYRVQDLEADVHDMRRFIEAHHSQRDSEGILRCVECAANTGAGREHRSWCHVPRFLGGRPSPPTEGNSGNEY